MILRRVALVLVVAAAAVYFGLALPRQRAAGAAADEHREARRELHAATTQASALQQRRTKEERLLATLAQAATATSLSGIRKRTLQIVATAPVSDVRLTVTDRKAQTPAAIHLQAQGAFLDLVALANRFSTESGFVLGQVQIASGRVGADGRAELDLSAVYPGDLQ